MRTLDFSPLYRSTIGFDRVVNILDSLSRSDQNQPNYPPYNIELTGDNQYRISMAIAGFQPQEVKVEQEENKLSVIGSKAEEDSTHQYLHQGIAARNFERRFQLADHVKVESASMEHGLLHIDLVREIPEAMKPRTIEINSGTTKLESKPQAVA